MTLQATARSIVARIASSLSELAVQIRYAGTNPDLAGTVATAISAGIDRSALVTDQGTIDGMAGVVRFSSALEPSAWGVPAGGQAAAIEGQPVEVLFSGDTAWTRCRVTARKVLAGVVRLNISAEFEET